MHRFDNFIVSMLGNVAPAGRMWARVGLVVLIVAALMSFDFGRDVSLKHGVFLGLLSFVTAFGPEVAHKMWDEKKPFWTFVIAAACVPLLAIEFYSHAGYTAGIRGSNVETATVQNTKWDGAQDTVGEAKRKIAALEARAAELDANMKKLVSTSVNGWSVVTAPSSPDELKAAIDAKKLEIANESKRGGCKTKCEQRTNELAHLEKLRALAAEVALNNEQHAASLAGVANARNTAAATEHKSSTVVHQNKFLAKSVALVAYGSLEPTPEIIEASQQSASIAMAAVATGLPAFCFLIAGLYRIRGRNDEQSYEPAHDVTQANTFTAPTMARDLTPVITNTKVIDRHHRDPRVTDMLHLLAAAGRRSAAA